MSAEYAALMRDIRETPDGDTPRLVLADWLDENDDPDRAAFVRAQVELARLPPDSPHRSALEDREHELLAANERHWLGDIATSDGLAEWRFERGFVEEVGASPFCLLEHGRDLFATHPVRTWQVTGNELDMGQDLIGAGQAPWITRVEAIDLAGWFESVGEMERFLTRSDLDRLRELDLTGRYGLADLPAILGRAPFRGGLKVLRCGGRGAWDGDALNAVDLARHLDPARLAELTAPATALAAQDVRTILVSPFASKLAHLDLANNQIEPDAWDAFRTAKCRLRSLDLSGTPLAAISLDALLGCAALGELRSLDVSRCGSAVANVAALARSRFWTQAEELRIESGTVPAHALDPLFASAGPPALRTLDVANNYLRDAGLAELCEAAWAGSLTWLALSQNYLTDDGVRTLAASGRFAHLRTLHLSYNSTDYLDGTGGVPAPEAIGDAGLIALAESPSLANLRTLTASGTEVTAAGIDAVLNGRHWSLSGLGLSACNLGRDAVRVLAESPRLARLNWLDLGHNPLRGDVLLPLAESPYLCPLTELDLRGVSVDETVHEAFRRRLGRRLSL